MKFAKYQSNNLVPEWRRKYLDVSLSVVLLTSSTKRARSCSRRLLAPNNCSVLRSAPGVILAPPITTKQRATATFEAPFALLAPKQSPRRLTSLARHRAKQMKTNKVIMDRCRGLIPRNDLLLQGQRIQDHR